MNNMLKKIPFVILLVFCINHAYTKQLTVPFFGKFIPNSVPYFGQLSNTKALKGDENSIIISYYSTQGNKRIYREKFTNVLIENGRFKINLGCGKKYKPNRYQSLKDVFINHDTLSMAFSINRKPFYPPVILKPAGHSIRSANAIAGVSESLTTHSKAYDRISKNSAIQAIILSDKKSTPQPINTHQKKTNPLTLSMRGPTISQPAYLLPKASQKIYTNNEVNAPRHESVTDVNGIRYGTSTLKQIDELVNENKQRGSDVATPDTIIDFPGMGNIDGQLPPDIEGAVGPNHYVQQVNLSTSIYNKDGTIAVSAFNTNQLWNGFGGVCESDNSGDAIALYDEQADRWILSQFAVATGESVCFAVSTTSDPTGNYFLYELATQRLPDFFKLGVWPAADNNAYFMSTNSGAPGKYDVYAIDRESLLNGDSPRPAQFFQDYYNLLMPADSDGTPPDATTPGYFYTFRDGGEPYFTDETPIDSLDIFEFDVDWNNPANTTMTRVQEITVNEGLAEFNWTVCGFFRDNCLPQPGGLKLDASSWWPMQRFPYRKIGSKQVLLGTWVVNVEVAPAIRAAPRWFVLNKTIGDWSIVQQGTFSPDAEHRFLPSIAMDGSEGIGMVFSKVSNNTFASMLYTAHGKDDALGSMRTEKVLKAGTGVQTSSLRRWGDYASIDVDPTDNCTFWMTSEYIPITDDRPWETQIAAFRLPDCVFMEANNSRSDVCSLSNDNTSFDLQLSNGFSTTTQLSTVGCPTGATCSFTNNPIINPSLTSTLNVSNLSATAIGANLISVNAVDSVDASINSKLPVTINIFDNVPSGVLLQSPITDSFNTEIVNFSWTKPANAKNYNIEIDDDHLFNSIDMTLQTEKNNFISTPLNLGVCYFWRVIPDNVCGTGAISEKGYFYTHLIQDNPQLNSSDIPKTLLTNIANTVTSTLLVSGVGKIADVNVNNFTGTHTWFSELNITLTSPSGTILNLMQHTCGDSEDWSINFDDEATIVRWPCPATDGGTYQANNPLSVFDGEDADGVWTLTIDDEHSRNGGTLDSWGLTFKSSIDPGIAVCNLFENSFE